MRRIEKIRYSILTLFIGFVFWQFRLFNRFNYLTAKIDIFRNQPKIVEIGILGHFGIANNGLNQKFGFEQFSIHSFATTPQLRGIKVYNQEIEKHLNDRNGNNWRKKYDIELDSVIKLELMK